MDVRVEIRGLRELNAAFKAVDRELPQKLKGRFLAIAETVASAARGKVPFRSGQARLSYHAKATTKGASIAFGGRAAEYAPWLEFGGKVGIRRSVSRSLVPGGRYLYPTIAAHNEQITTEAEDAIAEAAHDAGFETEGF